METHSLDMLLTIAVLSMWFLFPLGLFLSVSHVDKNTDQIIQLDHLRHAAAPKPLRVLEIPRPERDWHWAPNLQLTRAVRHY